MRLSDFDYFLPKDLVAQYPSDRRDESRLLVLHKDTGEIEHRIFRDVAGYFAEGDLLVLNNTKVVPARLIGKKETGGKIEALILQPQAIPRRGLGQVSRPSASLETSKPQDREYEALLKPARGCRAGSKLIFGSGELKAEITRTENGRRFLRFNCNGDLGELLERVGQVPLPPYIKRDPVVCDRERYQTVYAEKKGAVAAPTAGLHFTNDILEKISKKGTDIEYITLHVGYGTFRPVKCEDVKSHKMEKEYFEIKPGVLERLSKRKARVIAVGTTTCRTLESTASQKAEAQPRLFSGWTDLFIYPGYRFNIVDALLTNFHLPKTTLLMLVSAFCGRELLFKAYQEAIKERYRFYSYGDAMLIL